MNFAFYFVFATHSEKGKAKGKAKSLKMDNPTHVSQGYYQLQQCVYIHMCLHMCAYVSMCVCVCVFVYQADGILLLPQVIYNKI